MSVVILNFPAGRCPYDDCSYDGIQHQHAIPGAEVAALATATPTENPATPDGSTVAPLDVERLASALAVVLRPPTTPMAGGFLEFAAAIVREYAALGDKP